MHNVKCCGLIGIFSKILLIIGGLNWGLVGIGMFMNTNLNLVNIFLGSSWPVVESIVYILVGLAAVLKIFSCGCVKCKTSTEACGSCCGTSGVSEGEPKM